MSAYYQAWLAQSVEHETLNLGVVGSSPTLGDPVLMWLENKKKFIQSVSICIETNLSKLVPLK